MRRFQLSSLYRSFLAVCSLLFLLLMPGVAYASAPAYTETLQAGPYLIDATLDQNPPTTDQADTITIVPHESNVHLTGKVLIMPGLGTDAVELRSALSSQGRTSMLVGSIRLPVRGAWNIVVQLQGSRGSGQASFPITVGAPGAMPIWMGWLIALLPFLGVAWLLWHQYRYRQKLLAKEAL